MDVLVLVLVVKDGNCGFGVGEEEERKALYGPRGCWSRPSCCLVGGPMSYSKPCICMRSRHLRDSKKQELRSTALGNGWMGCCVATSDGGCRMVLTAVVGWNRGANAHARVCLTRRLEQRNKLLVVVLLLLLLRKDVVASIGAVVLEAPGGGDGDDDMCGYPLPFTFTIYLYHFTFTILHLPFTITFYHHLLPSPFTFTFTLPTTYLHTDIPTAYRYTNIPTTYL